MPTARLPIDAAHRAASSDAHAIDAITGLTDALAARPATGHRVYHLDAYSNFFRGLPYVLGQATSATTLTADVGAGADVIPVASAAGMVAGMALVTNAGAASYQILSVVSVNALNVTVTPAISEGLTSGAVIAPVWVNSSHLTTEGLRAWAYWVCAATDENGETIITGTPKITVLGDSWVSQDPPVLAAVVSAVLPGSTLVNAGVSGNTSTDVIARFDSDVPSDSDFVVFNEPGVNDVLVSPSTIAANLETLVLKIRAIGAVPIYTGFVPLADHATRAKTRAAELTARVGSGIVLPGTRLSGLTAIAPVMPDANSYGLGTNALAAVTAGTGNIAIGTDAGKAVTIGGGNTFIGRRAGTAVTTGYNNTAIGESALYSGAAISANTAIGQGALSLCTAGENVAIGHSSLLMLTGGTKNVAIGRNAGYSAPSDTTKATTTGAGQTLIGYQSVAGPAVSYATTIGFQAQALASGSVAIGADNTGASAVASGANDFVLGTALHHVQVPGKLTVTGVVKPQVAATASRPAANTAGAGAMMYDSTLSKPIWSDGTVWRDAAGTEV